MFFTCYNFVDSYIKCNVSDHVYDSSSIIQLSLSLSLQIFDWELMGRDQFLGEVSWEFVGKRDSAIFLGARPIG